MNQTPVFGNPTDVVTLEELKATDRQLVSILKSERKHCFACGIKLMPNFTSQVHFQGCVVTIIRRLITNYDILEKRNQTNNA